jgi:hypothetical protein
MSYWARYDRYLQEQAKTSPLKRISGRLHSVMLPYFLAILAFRAVFEATGRRGPIGFSVYGLATVLALVGLVYAGSRFIWWGQQHDRDAS